MTLKELLARRDDYNGVSEAARDAKHKLDVARGLDVTVARVSDVVRSAMIQDDYFFKEDEYYALLALELLRRNEQLQRQVLEFWQSSPNQISLVKRGDL